MAKAFLNRSNILYFLIAAILVLYGIQKYLEKKPEKKEGFLDMTVAAYAGISIVGVLIVIVLVLLYMNYSQGTLRIPSAIPSFRNVKGVAPIAPIASS
jgi:hypothetical protein